jgi:hypothetical protein
MEPSPLPGTIRIRWNCSCGTMMWDDYSQRNAEAASLLQARLDWLFRAVPSGHSTAQNGSNIAWHPLRAVHVLGNSLRELGGVINRRNARQRDPENISPPSRNQSEPDATVYLLTCVDTRTTLPRLFQKKWSSVEDDKAYFQMLCTLYETSEARWKEWLTFRTVTAIEYARVCDQV